MVHQAIVEIFSSQVSIPGGSADFKQGSVINGENADVECPSAKVKYRPDSLWNCLLEHALKISPGISASVRYCIPVPDFYLVLHGLRCWKSTIMD